MTEILYAWADIELSESASVYMDGTYQRMFAEYDNAESKLLLLKFGEEIAYLPMLIRNLGVVKEAYSAYGYGGVLGNIVLKDSDLLSMKRFLASEGVVSLFVRHSPFLHNQILFPDSTIEFNRVTYSRDLKFYDQFEHCLADLPPRLRRDVKICRKQDFSISIKSLLDCDIGRIKMFYGIYNSLMQAKGVHGYYEFSEDFFIEHANKLGDSCDFVEVVDNNTGLGLAGVFFLKDTNGWVHYHLSAGNAFATETHAMKYLISVAIFHYGRLGYRFMHLGGGHSIDESDGLSRFKSIFSHQRLSFYCSKIICDDFLYNRERNRIKLSNPNLFMISDARGGALV